MPPETRLYSYSLGFLRQRQVRRILALSGYRLAYGLPPKGVGKVVVWGDRKVARRGRLVARKRQAQLVTVEDAFLRSVLTGRSGAPPLGLVIDEKGLYFDCSRPSDLEDILNFSDLETPELLRRAEDGLARLHATGLSKYNAFDPAIAIAEQDYVLVIDQTRNDASIRLGGADAGSFAKMLDVAKEENPGKTILIKTHPEVVMRHRKGHFGVADLDDRTRFITDPISPRRLIEKAESIYTVTSLMGFEAILAGRRPRVFGRPFYGGWGLSEDEQNYMRRKRRLNRETLFAGTMLLYPKWYDPYRDRLCDFATVVDTLEAQARAWNEDCHGYSALGIRLWKRAPFRRFFAASGRLLSFEDEVARAANSGKRGMVWAGKETAQLQDAFTAGRQNLLRVEDGFLRSRGLGAELQPPLSLVLDGLGIYYDPSRESALERLLNDSDRFTPQDLARAARLRAQLLELGVSKYNVGQAAETLGWPKGKRVILVPGQVEDDASILLGAGEIKRNDELLRRVRQDAPDAFIVYKPHPDVEAGLRKGRISDPEVLALADVILTKTDAIAAINACDEVWTMTSLLGFEALLRGKPVTCLGSPFYAGWGRTRDLGPELPRRKAQPSLDALIHAALIAYPRYFDPKTGLAAPVEVVVERLATGEGMRASPPNRILSRLQGVFSGFAPLWR